MQSMNDDVVREALRQHGRAAASFQALEPGISYWRDDDSGAVVAYADTGSAWVAIAAPLVAPELAAAAATRFIEAARANHRRACFFACEDPAALGLRGLVIGEQPWWNPTMWPATLAAHKKLREQLRRARAKGVIVRAVDADEVAAGTSLRHDIDAMIDTWHASRQMEPMGFIVRVAPFIDPHEHRYFVAERNGAVIGFLSLVPIYCRPGKTRGWLGEDLFRNDDAVNGTSELLVDAAMNALALEGVTEVTWGLAPLSGNVPLWLRSARALGRGLYDFHGLRAWKTRLYPQRWQAVALAAPSPGPVAIMDSLRAFANGSLVRFGVATAVRRAGALPWMLAVPLVPWTVLLIVRAFIGRTELFGYARSDLIMWSAFDAVLAVALFAVAKRPRFLSMMLLTSAAGIDATWSVAHVATLGFGRSGISAALRTISMLAPVVGAIALAWSTRLTHRQRKRRR